MGALSGELTINLAALQKNYQILDGLSSYSCETGVAVKADAYGLGAHIVIPALHKAGSRRYFVATLDEGIQVRDLLPDAHIYILNGFSEANKDIYISHNLVPVLNSLGEVELYRNFVTEAGNPLSAILHFDTGMNRLGLPADETIILCENLSLLDGIKLDYVMSHFSSSDEKDNPVNQEQYKRFTKIADHFKNTKLSLCNSGGIFLSPNYHMDLTRPGIALYGGQSVSGVDNIMHATVSLKVPILQIRGVKKGEKAGYNGTYCFHKNSHIAIISIGYADGLLRSLGGKGHLYWGDYKVPIRGRVSMDLVICDLEEIPDRHYPRIGDMVEVVGDHQTIDDLARDADTISYEMLTNLGRRYKRSYIGA